MKPPTYADRARALVDRWLFEERTNYEVFYAVSRDTLSRAGLERRIADALRRAEQKASKERGR